MSPSDADKILDRIELALKLIRLGYTSKVEVTHQSGGHVITKYIPVEDRTDIPEYIWKLVLSKK